MVYDKYRFKVPEEKMIRLIVDTDAKNEADDDFAIVQALLSPKFDIVGLIAAHFGTAKVPDSMEQSYEELKRVLAAMHMEEGAPLYRGARDEIGRLTDGMASEGADRIIEEAMKPSDRPLYAIFLGPLTDMAIAYKKEPRIANRVKVVWIGGGTYPAGGEEFNLKNDIGAANVVFSSPLEVWQVPKNVYEMMPVSFAELCTKVAPKGEIGDYLCSQLFSHALEGGPRRSAFRSGETWVLGDSPAVGLLLYEDRFSYDWVQAPAIGRDMEYIHHKRNRPIRVYRQVNSRLILEDLFAKLELFQAQN